MDGKYPFDQISETDIIKMFEVLIDKILAMGGLVEIQTLRPRICSDGRSWIHSDFSQEIKAWVKQRVSLVEQIYCLLLQRTVYHSGALEITPVLSGFLLLNSFLCSVWCTIVFVPSSYYLSFFDLPLIIRTLSSEFPLDSPQKNNTRNITWLLQNDSLCICLCRLCIMTKHQSDPYGLMIR